MFCSSKCRALGARSRLDHSLFAAPRAPAARVPRYLLPHSGNKNYKGLLKALMRAAMEPLSVDDAKEVEQVVAGKWRARP